MKWFRIFLLPFRWLVAREAGLFEVISGFASVGWGALALQTFPPQDQPASLDVLEAWDIKQQVACVAIVIGFGQAFAFGLIDCKWRRPWLRWVGATFEAALWCSLAMSAVFSPPIPPGVVWLFAGLAGNLLLLPRIMRATHHGQQ